MSNSKLALLGGTPVINRPLEPYKSMGEEEVHAAAEVIRSGVLSAYIGAPGPGFMGGPKVRALEAQAAEYFGVKHAIAVNSWTSGLIAAVGAIGVEPGDEIITTPWTMAATATAILHWNAIPVFADIDPDTFNIDPQCVEKLITPRTKAIMSVDIFGQSADMKALRAIADRHGLKIISDTAQAPGAKYGERHTGTLADIGGFSLNYHKHIHCGEGGILVTNDDRLAKRMCLIRNHAEAVIQTDVPAELCNMLGYNFRLGEIEAAIASLQLQKLEQKILSRQKVASELNNGLSSLSALTVPKVGNDATHVYYVYGLKFNTANPANINRADFCRALMAEGVPSIIQGYQNLHRLPLFTHKIAYGTNHFPWSINEGSRAYSYSLGICPVAEELHAASFIGLNLCLYELGQSDVTLIIEAFSKVHRYFFGE